MFGKFRREQTSIYDAPITKTLDALETYDTTDAEFRDAMEYLERLAKLKQEKRSKVSPDTLAIVFGNIGVALIVVMYEQNHVITSKAKDLLLRLK